MDTIKPHIYSHSINGVQVKPLSEDGKRISILYNGRLKNTGAEQIYLHYGQGNKNSWHRVNEQPMENQAQGWEKTVQLAENKQLNFCFKDNTDNWDNNQGSNWAYRISD